MLDVQKYIGKPKIAVDEVDDLTTRFEVKYLPKWFGHTIGNAFRRAILGYSLGGAITGLKINGIDHEYSTIDGVKESVVDIMLNIKKMRFRVDEDIEDIQWVSQRFDSVGKFKSSDINFPTWIELLNEDVYLFEITDSDTQLVFDLRVEKWYGYLSIDRLKERENQKEQDRDIGLLLIDNSFKAVDYVKYDVQEHIDDFVWRSKDELILEIKTISEKISGREILSFASEVVNSYVKMFMFDESFIDKSVLVKHQELNDGSDKMVEDMDIKTMPIEALPLSERTRKALVKNDILYIEDLEWKKKSELLSLRWVGKKAVQEVQDALEERDKSLAE